MELKPSAQEREGQSAHCTLLSPLLLWAHSLLQQLLWDSYPSLHSVPSSKEQLPPLTVMNAPVYSEESLYYLTEVGS